LPGQKRTGADSRQHGCDIPGGHGSDLFYSLHSSGGTNRAAPEGGGFLGDGPDRFRNPEGPLVFLPSLAIGDFEEKGIEALILDLPSGGNEEGILGLSFLNRFRYTIDPGANELILRR
jgi:hypothetical protein